MCSDFGVNCHNDLKSRLEFLGFRNVARGSDWTPKREILIDGDVCRVPLTKGYVALVDAEFAALVRNFNWSVMGRGALCYAVTSLEGEDGTKRHLHMHRLIAMPSRELVVDHVNGDGLDNRLHNIRVVTQGENNKNKAKRSIYSSRYKGVSKVGRKYRARIEVNGRKIECGRFDSEEDAARAYDIAAMREFGCLASTNFDRSNYDLVAEQV